MDKLPPHYRHWDQRIPNEPIFKRNFLFDRTIHPLLERPNTTNFSNWSESNAWGSGFSPVENPHRFNPTGTYLSGSVNLERWNREAECYNLNHVPQPSYCSRNSRESLPVRQRPIPTVNREQYQVRRPMGVESVPCTLDSSHWAQGGETIYSGVQRNTDNESKLFNHHYYNPTDTICDSSQLRRDNRRAHIDFLERESVCQIPKGENGLPDFDRFRFNKSTSLRHYQPLEPTATWNIAPSCDS